MKTIDEAAVEHINSPHQIFTRSSSSFKAGAEFVQRWIPVKEELPIINEDTQSSDYVLILVDNRHWIKGFFYNGKWYTSGFLVHNVTHDVTHWRPIEIK